MKDSINRDLNKLVGTSKRYDGKDIYIESFKKLSSGKICVLTHTGTFPFLESEIYEKFIDQLEEVKVPDFKDRAVVSQNTRALAGFTPSAENIELKASLMEMLAKVKGNPNAIPQAKSVCEIAGTMINIQKNEMEMIRMVNKLKE